MFSVPHLRFFKICLVWVLCLIQIQHNSLLHGLSLSLPIHIPSVHSQIDAILRKQYDSVE